LHLSNAFLTLTAGKGTMSGLLLGYPPGGPWGASCITPAVKLSLERALDFINDDELVETTPSRFRMRK
jgi:hypothetical protein